MAFGDCEIHLPGDAAVAEVAGGARAEFGDVESFGEVHFEHGADAGSEGEKVGGVGVGIQIQGSFAALRMTAFNGDCRGGAVGGVGGVHGGGVGRVEAGLGEGGLAGADGFFVAVEIGVRLDELDAAAMAVHVAEAAYVHEDVELEGLSGGEGAREFVVAAAVAGAEGDEFGDAGRREGGDGALELTPGVVGFGIEERGGEFDFEGAGVFDQVERPGRTRWAGRTSTRRQRRGVRRGRRGRSRWDEAYLTRVGRGLDVADEGIGEAKVEIGATGWIFGIGSGSLVEQHTSGIAGDVPGGFGGGGFEALTKGADSANSLESRRVI